MRGTTVAKAGIAISLFWIALVACGTILPIAHRTSSSDLKVPYARACLVDGQSCLSMSPEPPRLCLTTSGRCAMYGRVQPLDLRLN
jgi:hypothetical protein